MDEKWLRRYAQLARLVASWSKDPSTKVGAVIFSQDKILLSIGYNGFPRGYPDLPELYEDRSQKHALVVHAELNAILNAHGRDLRGAYLICTHHPCSSCARAIVQSGISKVYYLESLRPDWSEEVASARELFEATGVQIQHLMFSEEDLEERNPESPSPVFPSDSGGYQRDGR